MKSISSYFSTLSVAHNFFLSFLNILWYSYFLRLWAWCIRGFLHSLHLHNPNHILIFVLFSIWVFPYKIRIIYFLLLKIFSSIKFRFLSWIIVRYWTDISHHSCIYLTWSSCFDHDYIFYFLNLFGNRRASSLYHWVGSCISLILSRSCSSFCISGKRTFAVLLVRFSTCSGNIILLNNVWIAWCVVYFIISTFRSFVAQNLLSGHRWCLLYSCSFFII